jgi:phosphohistidine phosphatase
MNLYLLRHGIAVERGTRGYERDADRPLTLKGRRKLRHVIAAMRVMDLRFDVILSSPLVRARETAKIASKRLRKKLTLTQHLAPGASAAALVRLLQRLKREDVLLVGHEPDLSRLASLLLTGGWNLPLVLRKGGLCKLSIERLRNGRCAVLEWLLTPQQMEAMS